MFFGGFLLKNWHDVKQIYEYAFIFYKKSLKIMYFVDVAVIQF